MVCLNTSKYYNFINIQSETRSTVFRSRHVLTKELILCINNLGSCLPAEPVLANFFLKSIFELASIVTDTKSGSKKPYTSILQNLLCRKMYMQK